MIRHIIWDFDGTLFDTYSAIVHSFVTVLRSEFQLDYAPETIRKLVGIDTKHCATHIGEETGISANQILLSAREFYNTQDTVSEKPHDYAKEVCEEIAQHGYNALITHRDRASTIKMLTQFGMLHLFPMIITADDNFPLKPSPDSFCHVLRATSMRRDETLGIGDRNLDVEAAVAAGIHSVFFNPEGEKHPKAEINIRSLAQVMEL